MTFTEGIALLNQIAREVLGNPPHIRLWRHQKGSWYMFGYNTEPLTPSPTTKGRRWAALIYRRQANGNLHLRRAVYFNSRKKAKARSLKWWWAADARSKARTQKKNDEGNFDDRADAFEKEAEDLEAEKTEATA